MVTSFYTEEEVNNIGLKSCGRNVLISRKASIYSPESISVADNVRIDDFCILSGKINIGRYVHIAAYCALYAGTYGITIGNFSGSMVRRSLKEWGVYYGVPCTRIDDRSRKMIEFGEELLES